MTKGRKIESIRPHISRRPNTSLCLKARIDFRKKTVFEPLLQMNTFVPYISISVRSPRLAPHNGGPLPMESVSGCRRIPRTRKGTKGYCLEEYGSSILTSVKYKRSEKSGTYIKTCAERKRIYEDKLRAERTEFRYLKLHKNESLASNFHLYILTIVVFKNH